MSLIITVVFVMLSIVAYGGIVKVLVKDSPGFEDHEAEFLLMMNAVDGRGRLTVVEVDGEVHVHPAKNVYVNVNDLKERLPL